MTAWDYDVDFFLEFCCLSAVERCELCTHVKRKTNLSCHLNRTRLSPMVSHLIESEKLCFIVSRSLKLQNYWRVSEIYHVFHTAIFFMNYPVHWSLRSSTWLFFTSVILQSGGSARPVSWYFPVAIRRFYLQWSEWAVISVNCLFAFWNFRHLEIQ